MAKLKITPLNQFVKGVFHFYDIFFHIFPNMDTFYSPEQQNQNLLCAK